MAWNKIVTADSVIQRLYENQSLYQETNRSYDSLVRQGATSVRRPKLATLAARKNAGTAAGDAARKKTLTDTTMVETDLDTYTVPILNELAGEFGSNGMLRKQYEISMTQALTEQFNTDVLTAAEATANVEETVGAELGWQDFIGIFQHYKDNKVPEDGLVIVVSSALMQPFYNIDVIKSAMGFNKELLQQGMGNQMLGAKWYISGLVPQIGGKNCVVSYNSKGLAFILSRFAEIKETYDPGEYGVRTPGDVIDLCAHAGCELDDDAFAYIVKEQ